MWTCHEHLAPPGMQSEGTKLWMKVHVPNLEGNAAFLPSLHLFRPFFLRNTRFRLSALENIRFEARYWYREKPAVSKPNAAQRSSPRHALAGTTRKMFRTRARRLNLHISSLFMT